MEGGEGAPEILPDSGRIGKDNGEGGVYNPARHSERETETAEAGAIYFGCFDDPGDSNIYREVPEAMKFNRDWSNDDTVAFKPGSYGKDANGVWMICFPDGLLGNLKNHSVTEHEDGTITVSPSILVMRNGHNPLTVHGYLERGIWKDC